MSTIETAGALRPGTTDTPLDQRSRISTLADMAALPLPYVGQIVYCLDIGRYYKIQTLKAKLIGALTVPDAEVDSYIELPVTTAELQTLIVQNVLNNPSILTFLEELIAARIEEAGIGKTPGEEMPYTYPEGIPVNYVTLTLPNRGFFMADTAADISEYVWGEEDYLTVEVYQGYSLVSYDAISYDGINFVEDNFHYQCANSRVRVNIDTLTAPGELKVLYKRQGVTKYEETVNFTGFHVPRYFTRPNGEGNWLLKINDEVVDAEFWNGSEWEDFPSAGLGNLAAGKYIRPKVEPEFPAIARWSNNGTDGEPFLYTT